MSFAREWERAQQAAEQARLSSRAGPVAGGGRRADGTGARAAGGPDDGALPTAPAGRPSLRSRADAWSGAAEALARQRSRVSTALDRLAAHQHGLAGAAGTAATSGAAAQRALARSWSRYLTAVAARCHTLESRLRRAGRLHHGNDEGTSALFTTLAQRYQDTRESAAPTRQAPP